MNTKPTACLLLAAAAWLPACATQPHGANPMSCPANAPNVQVRYGDSYLEVDALKNVKAGCPLVFMLMPKSVAGPNGLDYSDVAVTIRGKDGPTGASWIQFFGTAAATPNRRFSIDTPSGQSEGTYFYLVTVDQVGSLDPRVNVQR